MSSAVYRAGELAELLDVSTWAIYESVRRGDCPVAPITVGRRLVWPRAAVDALLGLGEYDEVPAVPTTVSESSTRSRAS